MRILGIYQVSCIYCLEDPTKNRCRLPEKSSCFGCRSFSRPIEGLSLPENLQLSEHKRRNKLAVWEAMALWLAFLLSVFNFFIESMGRDWWLGVLSRWR